MSTHKVLSYAKRIDDICLGEWWQSKRWLGVSRILVAIQYIIPQNPYELALKYSLERIYKFMKERKQENRVSHISIESRGKQQNLKLESAFETIKNGENWKSEKFPFEIKFIDKKSNSTGLQLADLVVEPIRSQYLRPHKVHPNFKSLEHKFYCRGGRNLTGINFNGYGLKVFP